MRRVLSILLSAALAAPLASGAAPVYTVTAIGAGTFANDINNLGQVVGSRNSTSGYSSFLYSGGLLTDIGASLGVSNTAWSINDAGQVVGDTAASTGFLYSGGTAGIIAGVNGAYGINNAGTIVGYYTAPVAGGTISHAYSLAGGTLTDLGAPVEGGASFAFAINNKGDVVGEATRVAVGGSNMTTDPFLYHAGTITSLGNFGGTYSQARSINDERQVVGYVGVVDPLNPAPYPFEAFLYDAAGLHNLGSLAPHTNSVANDINNLGQIVGMAGIAEGEQHGFIYEGGSLVDLNTLIDPASGWTILSAAAINDQQQIVGQACKADICEAVRLDLVPAVPEPPVYALMLAGLVLMRRRRAR
jgi:probable HAF family extracellular repeat protein